MGILKDYIEHVSDSFQTLFNLDAVDHLTESENIERVINHTATVAWVVYTLNPFPLLDLATLTPIQAKMAVHIARLKGFEVTQERAKDTVLEIMGVLGMTLTAQLMISTTAKLIPIVGSIMGGPLIYAATYAIGNVVDYYYDCLRSDQKPSNEAMKDLFVEQFRVGKAKGEKVDRSEIQRKADELRRRVAERDPSLATETRLPPREESLRRPAPASSPPPAADGDGGRRKIKITLGGKGKSEARATDEAEELVAPVRKTIGPSGRVGPEPAPAPPAKSLGAEQAPPSKSLGPEPAPPPRSLGPEPAATATPERATPEPERYPTPNAVSQREDDRLGAAPTPPRGVARPSEAPDPAPAAAVADAPAAAPEPPGAVSIVDQLERLGRLKTQGVLSADEFDQAKRKILGLS